MKNIIKFLMVFLGIFTFTFSQIEIKYPNIDGLGEDSFGFQLLKLVLSKTEKDYLVILEKNSMNQNRAFLEIEKGTLDVVDSGINSDAEKRFNPVYIPIDRGLLGWRIFIICKEQKDDFAKIKNLNDLRKKVAGQGIGWTDKTIIENAGIKVLTSPKLELLVNMVEKGRFDFLPLGANETHGVLKKFGKNSQKLVIDENIVLVYPFARIFYVSKEEPELHSDIILGLERAFEDESYQNFIMNHPFFKEGLEKANLNNRTIIRIDNPFFSENLKNIDEKWWYKVK